MGMPASAITTTVDVGDFVDQKRAAMQAHASQIPEESFFLQLPPDAFRAAFGYEWFIRRGAPARTARDLAVRAARSRRPGGTMRGSRRSARGRRSRPSSRSAGAVAPAAGAATQASRSRCSPSTGPYAAGVTTLDHRRPQGRGLVPRARRRRCGASSRDVYNIAKYLPQGLQDLLTSKNVEAPFTTDAYRDVRPEHEGPVPARALQPRVQRLARAVDVPHHAPRVVGLRRRVARLPRARARRAARRAAGDAAHRGRRDQRARVDGDPRARSRRPMRKGKIAIVGHSAGGGTAIRYAQQPERAAPTSRCRPAPFGVQRRRAAGPAREAVDVHHRARRTASPSSTASRTAYETRPAAEALRRDRRLRPPERR